MSVLNVRFLVSTKQTETYISRETNKEIVLWIQVPRILDYKIQMEEKKEKQSI